MRILLAGDTHGNVPHLRNVFAHACRKEADLIIQVGDYGYGWRSSQYKGTDGKVEDTYAHETAELVEKTGIPFWWLDGNHENFDKLYELPVNENGFREVAPGVHHIQRGTKFVLAGITFLVCGGAVSVDRYLVPRVLGKSWWAQESITPEDVELCASQGHADVLLTHDAPVESAILDHHQDNMWPRELTDLSYMNRKYVSTILRNCGAKLLFHGHMHRRFSDVVQNGVIVRGIDRDSLPMSDSVYLLDTEEEPMLQYAHVLEPERAQPVDMEIRRLSGDSRLDGSESA